MSDAPDSSQGDQLSISAEPDAETAQENGLSRSTAASTGSREFLLGSLLLLAVLTWAGWQWWHQEGIESSYRTAQQDEVEKRWDDAYAHYKAASGYRDADARAIAVATTIAQRDQYYRDAVQYADRQEWVASYQALQEVVRVQPDYVDTPELAQIAPSIEEGVRAEAMQSLSGTIAMRSQADPPGLYLRMGNRWVWLRGSDLWSKPHNVAGLHTLDADNLILYDVPGEGWVPPLPITGTPIPNPASRRTALKGRRLMAASLQDGDLRYTPLGFDPSVYTLYRTTNQHGVWGLRDRFLKQTTERQRWTSAYWGYELDYQALDSVVTSTLKLPGPNWAVIDISRGGQVLLVEVAAIDRMDGSGLNRLYLTNSDGTDRKLLYTVGGWLRSAQFSPSGPYILLTLGGPTGDGTTANYSVILLRLPGWDHTGRLVTNTEDQVLAERYARVGPGPAFDPLVVATFISQGSSAGKVVLAERGAYDDYKLTLSIFDPASPQHSVKVGFNQDPFSDGNPIGLMGGGLTDRRDAPLPVLFGWNSWGLSNTPTYSFEIVLLPARLASSTTILDASSLMIRLPVGKDERVMDLRFSPGYSLPIDEGYLVYLTANYSSQDGQPIYSVYSLRMADLDAPQLEPVQMYTRRQASPSPDPLSYNLSWSLRPEWLVYTDDGEMHARTYDGKVDLLLESGVAWVANFGPQQYGLPFRYR